MPTKREALSLMIGVAVTTLVILILTQGRGI